MIYVLENYSSVLRCPAHEFDDNLLVSTVTDIESDTVALLARPSMSRPSTGHIHLECLPLVSLADVEWGLASAGKIVREAALAPEELAHEISGRGVAEDELRTGSIILQRCKREPRVASSVFVSLLRKILFRVRVGNLDIVVPTCLVPGV